MDKMMADQKKTNERGLEFVKPIFGMHGMECLFQEQPQQYDYGTDFEVQLFENSKYTDLIIRGQLKSGPTHLHSESRDSFRHHISSSDANTWLKSNTPFIYVWYSPEREQAFWLNIRKYLRQNYRSEESFPIEIPKRNVLSKDSLNEFLEMARSELAGIPYTESRLYKPLYDFLYGEFNKKDEVELREILHAYETGSRTLRTSDYSKYYRQTIAFALAHRRLYSLSTAIANLEHLDFGQDQAVSSELQIEKYYWLAVMHYENSDSSSANDYLNKIPEDLLNDKHLLLRALIDDQRVEVKEAQNGYREFIDSDVGRDKHLKGVVCLLAGVLSRRDDDYKTAAAWFNEALENYDHDKFGLAVAKANMGALRFLEEKFGDSIDLYRDAADLFHQVSERDAEAEMLLNLSHVMYRKAFKDKEVSVGEDGFDTLRRSVYLRSKSDYLLWQGHVLSGYEKYADEGFEATAKTYTSRHSNNTFDGNREFRQVERISESLGSVMRSKWSQEQNEKSKFNLGKLTGDMELLRSTLYGFIIQGKEDGIEGVYKHAGDSFQEPDIVRILDWVFSIKGDRSAELGRLKFFETFAELIPDRFVDQVFELCLQYEKGEYSSHIDPDLGRIAVSAIERFSLRLNQNQLSRVLIQIMTYIGKDDWFKMDRKLEMLLVIPFEKLHKSDLRMIYDTLNDEILGRIRTRDPWIIYEIWTRIARQSGKGLRKRIYSRLSGVYLNEKARGKAATEIDATKDINPHVGLCLTLNVFKRMTSSKQIRLLVEYACDAVATEVERNTLKSIYSYGFGGVGIAKHLFPVVDRESRNSLIDSLLGYIASVNLVPMKRSNGIYSLLSLDSTKVRGTRVKKIRAEMFKILDERIPSEGDEHLSLPQYYDVSTLRGLALLCLATFGTQADVVILRARTMVYQASEESMYFMISSLGNLLSRRINSDQRTLITNMLVQWLSHDDPKVVSSSLEPLTQFAHRIRRSDYSVFISAIKALSGNRKYQIRRLAAKACNELVRQKTKESSSCKEILKKLKDDIHYQVRREATGRGKDSQITVES